MLVLSPLAKGSCAHGGSDLTCTTKARAERWPAQAEGVGGWKRNRIGMLS